jgi:hypothetical protein
MKNPRKIFSVFINDKEYDVYDISDKEHEGYNDTPKTWWLYYSDRLPEGMLPPADSDYLKPWDSWIQRLVWDIKFTQRTTSKVKWDELRFSGNTWCEMWCNKKLVYAFGTTGGSRGMSFAMAKAEYLQTILCEHPYNFLAPETEQGRKICWYGLPATVKVKSSESWCIGIIPDYTAGLNKEEWWREYENRTKKFTTPDPDWDYLDKEDFNEGMRDDYINWGDALSDGNIYWFRK